MDRHAVRTARRIPVDVRLKSDQGSNAALRGFLRACQHAGDRCAFASDDTTAKLDRLMQILRRHPIKAGAPLGTVTYDVGGLRSRPRALRVRLLAAIRRRPATALEAPGRPAQARQTSRRSDQNECVPGVRRRMPTMSMRRTPSRVRTPSTRPPHVPGSGGPIAVRTVSPHFGRYWTWLDGPCVSWPSGPDRYTGPFDRRTSNPLLFIGNLRDPATRYQDAVSASARMPGARLLTIDGTGHTSLTQDSSCARRVIAAYLVRKELPRRGSVCSPDHGLFD